MKKQVVKLNEKQYNELKDYIQSRIDIDVVVSDYNCNYEYVFINERKELDQCRIGWISDDDNSKYYYLENNYNMNSFLSSYGIQEEENLNNTSMKVTDLTETRVGKINPMYVFNEDMSASEIDLTYIKDAKECILIDRQVKYRIENSILHLDVMYFKFEDSYCNCVVLGYFNSGIL